MIIWAPRPLTHCQSHTALNSVHGHNALSSPFVINIPTTSGLAQICLLQILCYFEVLYRNFFPPYEHFISESSCSSSKNQNAPWHWDQKVILQGDLGTMMPAKIPHLIIIV